MQQSASQCKVCMHLIGKNQNLDQDEIYLIPKNKFRIWQIRQISKLPPKGWWPPWCKDMRIIFDVKSPGRHLLPWELNRLVLAHRVLPMTPSPTSLTSSTSPTLSSLPKLTRILAWLHVVECCKFKFTRKGKQVRSCVDAYWVGVDCGSNDALHPYYYYNLILIDCSCWIW